MVGVDRFATIPDTHHTLGTAFPGPWSGKRVRVAPRGVPQATRCAGDLRIAPVEPMGRYHSACREANPDGSAGGTVPVAPRPRARVRCARGRAPTGSGNDEGRLPDRPDGGRGVVEPLYGIEP